MKHFINSLLTLISSWLWNLGIRSRDINFNISESDFEELAKIIESDVLNTYSLLSEEGNERNLIYHLNCAYFANLIDYYFDFFRGHLKHYKNPYLYDQIKAEGLNGLCQNWDIHDNETFAHWQKRTKMIAQLKQKRAALEIKITKLGGK